MTKIKFTLPPELVANATEGILLGEFNNWDPEQGIRLLKMEDGSLATELFLTPGKTYEYRYLLSDGRWVNDNNTTTSSPIFGDSVENCVLTVPHNDKKAAVAKPRTIKKEKPEVTSDDLGKIEGINKKIASLLLKENIRTYKDLSKCTIKKLQLILDGAGAKFNVYDPALWPRQAKLAASGNWEALSKLQDELKQVK